MARCPAPASPLVGRGRRSATAGSLWWTAATDGTPIDEGSDLLSVLICTKNRPDLLQRCLRAILDGAALPDSILVVDQSDGDATRVTAGEVAASAPVPVTVLRSRTVGMAAGQNEGFRQLVATVILVTDDDCVPSPDWVETAHRVFTDEPQLGMLGGRVLPLDDERPDRLPVSSRTSTIPLTLDATTPPWDAGSGNNFAVSREAISLVGGNDERLGPGAAFRGGADMDLFRRLLRAGVRGRYDPSLLVFHERATQAERMARRIPYGYGTGIAVSLWWRQGDRLAGRLLRGWFSLRLRRLRRAVRSRSRASAQEEILLLWGTLRGLVRGAVLRDPAPRSTSRP